MDIVDIYILNLALTLGMFVVLVLRATFEFHYYRRLSSDAERRSNTELMRKVLISEKELFHRTEEGKELYDMLCNMFGVTHPREEQ